MNRLTITYLVGFNPCDENTEDALAAHWDFVWELSHSLGQDADSHSTGERLFMSLNIPEGETMYTFFHKVSTMLLKDPQVRIIAYGTPEEIE